MVRDLKDQDQQILEQLGDAAKFDELQGTLRRGCRADFCTRWKDELDEFHPNIIHFLTDLEEAHPSKVKGLVKMHKAARPDGKHGIWLLLASCGTPIAPASKFLQQSIAHLFPLLPSKMTDTKAVLQKIKCINDNHPNGLPESTINVGCVWQH